MFVRGTMLVRPVRALNCKVVRLRGAGRPAAGIDYHFRPQYNDFRTCAMFRTTAADGILLQPKSYTKSSTIHQFFSVLPESSVAFLSSVSSSSAPSAVETSFQPLIDNIKSAMNFDDRDKSRKSFNLKMMKAMSKSDSKFRNVEEIFRLWREMNSLNIKPDVVTYNFLIKALSLSPERYVEGFNYYRQIQVQSVKPTIVTFNELLKCAARARHIHLALFYLDELERCGIIPDKITAHFLMVTCAKAGEFDVADDLMDRMKAYGISTTQDVYVILAEGACSGGWPIRACEYMSQCVHEGLDVSSKLGEFVLDACLQANEDHGAYIAFKHLNEQCCVSALSKSTSDDRIHLDRGTHLAVLNLAARSGNAVLADAVWDSLEACGHKIDTEHYDAIWRAYIGNHDVARAVAVLSDMLHDPRMAKSVPERTFLDLTKLAVRSGSEAVNDALHTIAFRKFQKVSGADTNDVHESEEQQKRFRAPVKSYVRIVNSLIEAQIRLNSVEWVVQACFKPGWDHLCDEAPDASTLAALLRASELMDSSPFNETSKKILNLMHTNWTHIKHTRETYHILVSAQAYGDDFDAAAKTLIEMLDAGFIPSKTFIKSLQDRSNEVGHQRLKEITQQCAQNV